MIVVYGAGSSGKSKIAEDIACMLSNNEKRLYYWATMEKESTEAKCRIKNHRQMRANKGFITIEEEESILAYLKELDGQVVLLECMSNLLANKIYKAKGASIMTASDQNKIIKEVLGEILVLNKSTELVIVTNNVFGNYYSNDAWCDTYMKVLGHINQLLAKEANTFIEVTSGIPVFLKGENYWQ